MTVLLSLKMMKFVICGSEVYIFADFFFMTFTFIGGRGKRVAPLSTKEGTFLTDDSGYDRLTPGPPSPTPSNRSGPRHRRSESDPRSGTPNLADIAASCEPYLKVVGRRGK